MNHLGKTAYVIDFTLIWMWPVSDGPRGKGMSSVPISTQSTIDFHKCWKPNRLHPVLCRLGRGCDDETM